MIAGLVAAIFLLSASVCGAADVNGTVRIGGRPVDDAVVYLEGNEPPPPAVPAHAIMDQKNLAFLPSVLAVRRGTVVEFTNSDDVQHNVFTPSAIGGHFNLGTYNRGEARSVTLDQSGEAVVLCNIHMEMEAHIVVVDGPYFAVTAGDGAFRIVDVPPGTYTVRLWRRGWLSHAQAVEVGGGPLRIDVDARK
jgi:plastocyanin